MRSEGFFFRGQRQYTIFLYSRPEKANFRLAPRNESWHFLAAAQKTFFQISKLNNFFLNFQIEKAIHLFKNDMPRISANYTFIW